MASSISTKHEINTQAYDLKAFLDKTSQLASTDVTKAVSDCVQMIDWVGPDTMILDTIKSIVAKKPELPESLVRKIGIIFQRATDYDGAQQIYKIFAESDKHCASQLAKLQNISKHREQIASFVKDIQVVPQGTVSCLGWINDDYFAVGMTTGQLYVVDGNKAEIKPFGKARNRPVDCLATVFSSFIAGGSESDVTSFEVWDMRNPDEPKLRKVLKNTKYGILALKQLTNTNLANLAIGEGGYVSLWKLPKEGDIDSNPVKSFDVGETVNAVCQIEEVANGILGIGFLGENASVELWDVKEKPLKIGVIGSSIVTWVYAVNNGLMASMDKDRYLRIWNYVVSTTQPIQTFRVDTIGQTTIGMPSRNLGHLITLGEPIYKKDQVIQNWDTNTNTQDYSIEKPDPSRSQQCYKVTESADRTGFPQFVIGAIYSKGSEFYTLSVWNANDGRHLGRILGPNVQFTHLLAGESWIAGSLDGGIVRIWKINR